jgi:NADH:ubiquinone oxidoreductase subunit F (NADH-binding)
MGHRQVLLDGRPVATLDDYTAMGGGRSLQIGGELGPAGVLDELERSGLRGRGGAGFPAGLKWRSIASGGAAAGERFVVANGAEGEPGTFKDRHLLRHNPYLMVEGLVLAASVVGARRGYIALKASFRPEIDAVARALTEMEQAGWLAGLEVTIVPGPAEYLFGEEKALLEVIEGEDPLPRMFPPYLYGLFTTTPQMGWSAGRTLDRSQSEGANPTLVNNIETLSNVPLILSQGSDWYRSIGTAESPGTILATVSGDTRRHGVGEFEMGTPVGEIIEQLGGGLAPGRSIRYVLSGVSNPVLRASQLDTPASSEAMEGTGSALGTGGFVVYDDRTDPVELAHAVSRFLWIESCGQCPACKLGCEHITSLLGDALDTGEIDLALLSARLRSVDDAARCYLPTQEQRVAGSLIGDVRAMVSGERRHLLVAPIVDLVDGRCQIDTAHRHKRPDWTYEVPPGQP